MLRTSRVAAPQRGGAPTSVMNTLPSIGREGLTWPNIHNASNAKPKSISWPCLNNSLRQRVSREKSQVHEVMLTASKAPSRAPALLFSRSRLELVREGRYICRYSMLPDNSMPVHRLRITLTIAPKRARKVKPTSSPNGR